MAENQIPAAQRHAADTILEAAPNLSLLEFFDKAAYLYYCMDGEILDPSVYFDLTNDRDSFLLLAAIPSRTCWSARKMRNSTTATSGN